VRTRAAQINGCAYCVDIHTRDARAAGETEQRLSALPVWREVPYFSERERAALAVTEAVTVLTRAGVPDDVWADAAKVFDQGTTRSCSPWLSRRRCSGCVPRLVRGALGRGVPVPARAVRLRQALTGGVAAAQACHPGGRRGALMVHVAGSTGRAVAV
jgi:AhpD family alkylhydroperoxidase